MNLAQPDAPPIKSFEDDMHRIIWKMEELDPQSSELMFLLTVCLSIFPTLLKNAIAATSKRAQNLLSSPSKFVRILIYAVKIEGLETPVTWQKHIKILKIFVKYLAIHRNGYRIFMKSSF